MIPGHCWHKVSGMIKHSTWGLETYSATISMEANEDKSHLHQILITPSYLPLPYRHKVLHLRFELWVVLCEVRSWTQWFLGVPSNLEYSVILWFYVRFLYTLCNALQWKNQALHHFLNFHSIPSDASEIISTDFNDHWSSMRISICMNVVKINIFKAFELLERIIWLDIDNLLISRLISTAL